MQPTITIDATRWQQQALALSVALGKDGGEVLRDEARLFLKQVIRFTPPKNVNQGKNSVRLDLLRAMKPLSPELFTDETLKRDARTKTGPEMAEILKVFPGWENWKVRPFDNQSLHYAAWKKGSRIKGQRTIAYPAADVADYLKKKQSRVGRLRAGWAVAFLALGGSTSKWITRHIMGARGKIVDASRNTTAPSITIGNHAMGVGQTERIVANALRARANAMTRRIKLALSGYSADMAAGMRAKSRARKTPGSHTAT